MFDHCQRMKTSCEETIGWCSTPRQQFMESQGIKLLYKPEFFIECELPDHKPVVFPKRPDCVPTSHPDISITTSTVHDSQQQAVQNDPLENAGDLSEPYSARRVLQDPMLKDFKSLLRMLERLLREDEITLIVCLIILNYIYRRRWGRYPPRKNRRGKRKGCFPEQENLCTTSTSKKQRTQGVVYMVRCFNSLLITTNKIRPKNQGVFVLLARLIQTRS